MGYVLQKIFTNICGTSTINRICSVNRYNWQQLLTLVGQRVIFNSNEWLGVQWWSFDETYKGGVKGGSWLSIKNAAYTAREAWCSIPQWGRNGNHRCDMLYTTRRYANADNLMSISICRIATNAIDSKIIFFWSHHKLSIIHSPWFSNLFLKELIFFYHNNSSPISNYRWLTLFFPFSLIKPYTQYFNTLEQLLRYQRYIHSNRRSR